MTPVLPAFAGHVPKRFAEMHPEADIQQLSAWCGFEPTHFLNSSDPLFAKIQQSFMEKEIALSGEGNGNPRQYSCLENPMDRGAWWATVHGVAKSQT